MSVKTIPEHQIRICDLCSSEMDVYNILIPVGNNVIRLTPTLLYKQNNCSHTSDVCIDCVFKFLNDNRKQQQKQVSKEVDKHYNNYNIMEERNSFFHGRKN